MLGLTFVCLINQCNNVSIIYRALASNNNGIYKRKFYLQRQTDASFDGLYMWRDVVIGRDCARQPGARQVVVTSLLNVTSNLTLRLSWTRDDFNVGFDSSWWNWWGYHKLSNTTVKTVWGNGGFLKLKHITGRTCKITFWKHRHLVNLYWPAQNNTSTVISEHVVL